MIDLSKTTKGNVDQIDAMAVNEPKVIKVSHVTENLKNGEVDKQQPVSIHWFNGDGTPFKPCLTMRRVLEKVWAKDASTFVGRYLKLYNLKTVSFGKENTGGVRISHLSNIEKNITVKVKSARGKYTDYTVNKLDDLEILKCETEIAAKKGVDSFTKFGATLTAENKASLGADFIKEMALVAKNSDKKEG